MQIGKRATLLNLVIDTAEKHDIDARMLDAIIVTESTYDPLASRYEPHYKWLATPDLFAASCKVSVELEAELQKTSMGLCQIMGGTARDCGYTDKLLRLLDPKTNLTMACRYITRIKRRYSKLEDIISAYNAGSVRLVGARYSNQDYVDLVLHWIERLK